MNRKGLSLERLRAFELVAEARGIARAAPGEPAKQSQLSRQLSELETAVEVALFSGTRRKLRLTPAGARLLRVVRELSSGLADLRAETEPVRVCLGAGDSVLQWLVLPGLGALQPKARVRMLALSGPQVVSEVEEQALDLGIVRGDEPTRALRRTVIGQVEYAVFAPRSAPQAPLVIATAEPGINEALATLGAPGLECETFPQVARAVESGHFRGVLPLFASSAMKRPVTIERVQALDSVATKLVMVWRRRLDDVRPEAAQFRRALMAMLRRSTLIRG